ncbi:MFS transporter [Glaciimonas immobilis]|uniref:MFS family permease n=1 Tax=Glaciimonas immobilis TaxID=728004 RepID=A0A840RRK4_9BURK|nr:MFS transporter [Glaciimonas immobilis]KAF3996841.1 MFS transporter [Glaciimonas immobilis]MBB5199608.1 MFS family permease [Glaciimonas immobilis]
MNIWNWVTSYESDNWRLLRFQWSIFLLTVGARCNQLAVAWWALKETGSASLFSIIIACTIGAEVLSKPLLGWTGDRYSKMKIVLFCNVLTMFSAACLLALSFIDYFSITLVTFAMMLLGIAVGIRDPIQSSIIPQLTLLRSIAIAFNRKAVLSSIAMLLGPAIAGLLVSTWGVTIALIIDFALIAIAISMIVNLNIVGASSTIQTQTTQSIEKPLTTITPPWHTLISSGFKVVFRVKIEFYLALLAMMINLVLFPFFTIIVPFYVQETIQLPAWYIGLLDCSFGVGLLLSSKFLPRLLSFIRFRDRLLMTGFGLLGLNLLAIGLAVPYFILPIFFALGGCGLILINVNTAIVRTLATPACFRNRMVATVSFFSSLASPIGSLIVGLAIAHYGVEITSLLTGVITLTLMLGVALVPNIRVFMRMSEDELDGAYGRFYPSAFR